ILASLTAECIQQLRLGGERDGDGTGCPVPGEFDRDLIPGTFGEHEFHDLIGADRRLPVDRGDQVTDGEPRRPQFPICSSMALPVQRCVRAPGGARKLLRKVTPRSGPRWLIPGVCPDRWLPGGPAAGLMGFDSVVVFPFVVAGPLFTGAGLPRSHDVAAGDAVPA